MVDRFKQFSYSIFEISRCWHKLAGEEMAKYGLKGPHAMYLMALYNDEGLTAAELCTLCGRDKADVSRAMTIMEEKKLIQRSTGNAYRARLSLTEQGEQAARQVCQRIHVAVEHAGRGYDAEKRAIFYQVLGTVTENLHQLSINGLPE